MTTDHRDDGRNGGAPLGEERPMPPRPRGYVRDDEAMPMPLHELAQRYGTIAAGYDEFRRRELPALQQGIDRANAVVDAMREDIAEARGDASRSAKASEAAASAATAVAEELQRIRRSMREWFRRYASTRTGHGQPAHGAPQPSWDFEALVEDLATSPGFILPPIPTAPAPPSRTDSDRAREAATDLEVAKKAKAWDEREKRWRDLRWAVYTGVVLTVVLGVGGVLWHFATIASAREQGVAEGRAEHPVVTVPVPVPVPTPAATAASELPVSPAAAAPAPAHHR